MKNLEESTTGTVPTTQAVTAWKGKADKLVALESEIEVASLKLEKALKPIREKFEPDIEAKKKEAAKLKGEIVAFANEHRETLFAEGSVVKTKTSIITGKATPESVALTEGLAESEVIGHLKGEKKLAEFLDIKWSLSKPTIKKALADAGNKSRELLEFFGLTLREGFSVTVKSKGD